MKATGIIRTETEDRQVFEQRVPVKLDTRNRYIKVKIDGKESMYVVPNSQNIDNPIVYAITDPIPTDIDFIHGYYGNSNIVKTTVRQKPPNPSKRYLIVTIKG